MTITDPKWSAGLWIPNPTFSIPSRSGSGYPEGWDLFDGSSPAPLGLYNETEPWHPRVQQFTPTDSLTILRSAPISKRSLGLDSALQIRGMLYGWVGSSSSSNQIELHLASYDAADNRTRIVQIAELDGGDSNSSWVLKDETGTASLGWDGATNHFRVNIYLRRVSSFVAKIGFVGVGVWNDNSSSSFTTRVPAFPGSFATPSDLLRSPREVDLHGVGRTITRDRLAKPHQISFSWGGLSQTSYRDLRKLWHLNRGIDDDGATQNPNGYACPALIAPGHPAAPAGLYADFTSSFGIQPAYFFQDPPIYGGSLSMTERVL